MPRDWKGPYQRKLKRASTERGKKAANVRWERERSRRDKLARTDPVRVEGKIVERWVRIIGESEVRERTVYEFDTATDWRRKKRELFA